MKIAESPVWYRHPADLREAGHADSASAIEVMGLPLEIVFISHDRVVQIREYDYVEGRERPLGQRDTWWIDDRMPPWEVRAMRCTALIVVGPNGSHFTPTPADAA
jgi:hypothetical protein